jgi:hypothetical protein
MPEDMAERSGDSKIKVKPSVITISRHRSGSARCARHDKDRNQGRADLARLEIVSLLPVAGTLLHRLTRDGNPLLVSSNLSNLPMV